MITLLIILAVVYFTFGLINILSMAVSIIKQSVILSNLECFFAMILALSLWPLFLVSAVETKLSKKRNGRH